VKGNETRWTALETGLAKGTSAIRCDRDGQEQGSCPSRLAVLSALRGLLPALGRFTSALLRSALFLSLPCAFPVLVVTRFGLAALVV
jgi:hypothetical protein